MLGSMSSYFLFATNVPYFWRISAVLWETLEPNSRAANCSVHFETLLTSQRSMS